MINPVSKFHERTVQGATTAILHTIDGAAIALNACRTCSFSYIMASMSAMIYSAFTKAEHVPADEREAFKASYLDAISLSLDLVDAKEAGVPEAAKSEFYQMTPQERAVWIDKARESSVDHKEAARMTEELLGKFKGDDRA